MCIIVFGAGDVARWPTCAIIHSNTSTCMVLDLLLVARPTSTSKCALPTATLNSRHRALHVDARKLRPRAQCGDNNARNNAIASTLHHFTPRAAASWLAVQSSRPHHYHTSETCTTATPRTMPLTRTLALLAPPTPCLAREARSLPAGPVCGTTNGMYTAVSE